MEKKLISLFTVMCLMFGTLSTFTAFADDTTADITEISALSEPEAFRDSVNAGNTYVRSNQEIPKHIHKICADESCTDNHEDIEWTAWNSGTTLPDTAGNYYLTKDIELSAEWEMPDNTALCLNGHVISFQDVPNVSCTVLYAAQGKTNLYLTDCSYAEHKFSVGDKGLWVRDEEHGTKTLTGGVIMSPKDYAILSETHLNMYNVNISGSAGGILSSDTLNMYNCTIAGNSTWDGVCSFGELNMRNCSIFENTGDGVYASAGSVSIGGRMIISNNTINGKQHNLNLRRKITLQINSPLSEGSVIGVSTSKRPLTGCPTAVTGENDTDYSGYFVSDNNDKHVTYSVQNGENNVIYLEANTPSAFRIMSDSTGTILASAPTAGTYTAILSVYSLSNNQLQSTMVIPVTFDEPSVKKVCDDKFNSETSYHVKLMLWNNLENMKPCCESSITRYKH